MPSFHCSHASCPNLLDHFGFCAEHIGEQKQNVGSRNSFYDHHQRNPEAARFYHSTAWKQQTRAFQLARFPTCQKCEKVFAVHVHHVKPLRECTDLEKLDPKNLLSVCLECHNSITATEEAPKKKQVTGILDLQEDDKYFYDSEAADKPIRFIEKFCVHTENKLLIGKPFLLEPIQKKIIGDVYGWKDRETRLRRFNRVWWNGAAGAGKSPLLAALGVFELVDGNGERGNQIFCMASDYQQAKVIFDQAKAFLKCNPILASLTTPLQFEISSKTNGNIWRIISGKGPKAGMRPGIVFGDECHQWRNAECYHDIQGRMAKKAEPICWIATNVAEFSTGIYWTLQEEAEQVLSKTRKDDHLYPILWGADQLLAMDDPTGWRQANPLMGITVREDKIRDEYERSKGSPVLEARFRRLYMGQHVHGSNKWLDLVKWKAAQGKVDAIEMKSYPLFIGWDGSGGDDLCSAIFLWIAPNKFYVKPFFWLPAETAAMYEQKNQTTYKKWASNGDITLLPETTITPDVQKRIASEIIAAAKGHTVKAFAFDQKFSDAIVKECEQAKLTCIGVRQGYTLTPGCVELERRLKEGSIVIDTNAVMTRCAELVEVTTPNDHGCYWPVKRGAKGRSAGIRHEKIDGIVALVSAICEAKRQDLAIEQPQWTGKILKL